MFLDFKCSDFRSPLYLDFLCSNKTFIKCNQWIYKLLLPCISTFSRSTKFWCRLARSGPSSRPRPRHVSLSLHFNFFHLFHNSYEKQHDAFVNHAYNTISSLKAQISALEEQIEASEQQKQQEEQVQQQLLFTVNWQVVCLCFFYLDPIKNDGFLML